MMDKALLRVKALLGETAIERLQAAHVAVVGVGAVGGACVEALARSGVGHLTVVDADVFERSNLNRQPFSSIAAIGQDKTVVTVDRLHAIAPCCQVKGLSMRVTGENVEALLEQLAPHYLVDAIDDTPAKVALLSAAVQRGLPVWSAMGAARKTDPTQLRVADISKTQVCPLAKAVRQRLKAVGISHGVQCVYSQEKAVTIAAGDPLGSYMPVTASAGLLLAAEVIKEIVK